MSKCNPGFMPKLLGCVSESECGDVTLSCALLSLVVTLVLIFGIIFIIYLIYCFINGQKAPNQSKEKKN